ncbi:hypothetical protein [Paraburkholderia humisilvae]|uniref:Uncharacterized protein n=1 Tax=Paraburkholderia humisilvae TaxID=627669 RepID=A0A6J5DN28_9BURK|nr:hypothetical protein [Paraburkholderia humisilvae]CAB3754924.1 hypothetical protein LMG29542_02491 [Paraburkholderia humisilvae]
MSTVFFLVSLKTMQAVEVGCSSVGSMRGTQEPKALALFCHAHMSEVVEMMTEKDLEFRNLDHGELTTWTDENAAARYKAVTGHDPPNY